MEEEILFNVNKYDMKTDYEFLNNIKIRKDNNKYLGIDIDPNSIVFKYINDNTCMEVATKEEFYKANDKYFYNENTGLLFNVNKIDFNGLKPYDVESCVLYSSITKYFFDEFRRLKEKDDELRSKGEYLLLKNNKLTK